MQQLVAVHAQEDSLQGDLAQAGVPTHAIQLRVVERAQPRQRRTARRGQRRKQLLGPVPFSHRGLRDRPFPGLADQTWWLRSVNQLSHLAT